MLEIFTLVRWRPQIGDPTVIGWVTVAGYFLAAYLCLQAFYCQKKGPRRRLVPTVLAVLRVLSKHRENPPPRAKRAAIWFATAVLMLCLGINKQLDLQSLFTDLGRVAAYLGGFYETRRSIQMAFILAILAASVFMGRKLYSLTRNEPKDLRLAIFGILMLLAFIFVRAASFHHMDILLKTPWLGVQLNWVLELGGISVVVYAARLSQKTAATESQEKSGAS